jgi:hypothetical protein
MMCRSKAGGTSQGLRDIYPTLGSSSRLSPGLVGGAMECGMWNVDGPVRPCHRVEENSATPILIMHIFDRYDMHMDET